MSTHDFVLELRGPATGAVPAQRLRHLVPHRAADYGRMLARVADALVTDLTHMGWVSQQSIERST